MKLYVLNHLKNLFVVAANLVTVATIFLFGLPMALSFSLYGAAFLLTFGILLGLITFIQVAAFVLQGTHLVLSSTPFLNTIYHFDIPHRTAEFYKFFYLKNNSYV